LRGDVLADGDAAGEGDQVDHRIRDQFVGDLARIARDDRQHLRRQAGAVQQVGEQRAENGTFSEGLSTIRLLVAMLGTTLCATWFIGWLKGRDGADHAQQRRALRVDAALLAVRRQVAAEDLAVVAAALAAPNSSTSLTRPAS
jgi:hypothetical protein